jgi:hypothetical protein
LFLTFFVTLPFPFFHNELKEEMVHGNEHWKDDGEELLMLTPIITDGNIILLPSSHEAPIFENSNDPFITETYSTDLFLPIFDTPLVKSRCEGGSQVETTSNLEISSPRNVTNLEIPSVNLTGNSSCDPLLDFPSEVCLTQVRLQPRFSPFADSDFIVSPAVNEFYDFWSVTEIFGATSLVDESEATG